MQLGGLHGGGSQRAIALAVARIDTAVAARVPAPMERAIVAGLFGVVALLIASGLLAAAVVGGGPRLVAVEHYTGHLAGLEGLIPRQVPDREPVPGGGGENRAASRTVPQAPPPPAPPQVRGALPVGRGMWLYVPEQIEGGNVDALVTRAKSVGLTHVYVRTGSSRMGFYAQDYLNRLLPAAHANGIRVYAWDFPYLDNWQDDVNRSVAAITYTTPDGHRVDGFSADIETRGQGVNVAPDTARAYGAGLRRAVGPDYPLIATVPRPSAQLITYPFAEVVESFDAIAPMIYWLNRDPVIDVKSAMAALRSFNKPLMPIGQAYDGAGEGGRPGVPPAAEIQRFMGASEWEGAPAVSFWSWQHADQEAWDAIRDAAEFRVTATTDVGTPAQVRSYQVLLSSLGFPVGADGVWGPSTAAAISAYQRAARLPVTGAIDAPTRALMLTPFAPPVRPAAG
ncbi:MAG: hypothetical protein QOG87_4280 [Actinomycetota bacterium]|jgi:hypothetical protein